MSETVGRYASQVDDLKQQLVPLLAEVQKLIKIINDLEELSGLPKTELSGVGFGPSSIKNGSGPTLFQPTRSPSNIRPDEYLGEIPREAAKKFLASIRRAAPLDEIADAVQKGGAAITGVTWKDDLDQSLLRSTADVVKIQDKVYGLVSFYTDEQLARLRSTRRQKQPKEQSKSGPKKPRGRPKKKANIEAPKPPKQKPEPMLPASLRDDREQKKEGKAEG